MIWGQNLLPKILIFEKNLEIKVLTSNEWEHFGVKLELRLSRGGIISSRVLEIRNRKWDMGNRKWDMGLWLLKMRNCLKPNN